MRDYIVQFNLQIKRRENFMTKNNNTNSTSEVKGDVIRKNIKFDADGRILRGWFFYPNKNDDVSEKFPTIVMAHGYAGLKEMHLDRFAEKFASNGFAVIVFDYSGFGDSDGFPRQEVNPYQQIEEYSHAITYASLLDEVDSAKIGVWGTSYSGGHVIVLAGRDKRVKCVVSQVPTISGSESSLRRVPADKESILFESFEKDRIGRMKGKEPEDKTLVSLNQDDNPVYSSEEAVKWYLEAGERSENWINKVTLRSVEYSRSYNPGLYISKVSPVPLLMLVATEDKVTPTDLALKAYNQALEPKKLVFISGGHFTPYVEEFEVASNEAIEWFKKHLT